MFVFGQIAKKESQLRWFDRKRNETNVNSDNVTVLRDVFELYHNHICDSLNEFLASPVPGVPGVPANKVLPKIEKASKLEVGMYLLLRLDWQMCGRQQEHVRRTLCESCIKAIAPSTDTHFVDLGYHRLNVYGEIFNRTKSSGGDWADYKMQCHDWLINTMLHSQNDYNKMVVEDIPNVIIDPFEHFHIKNAFAAVEATLLVDFDCILKHIFADNDDFTLLPKEEVLTRIKAGQ